MSALDDREEVKRGYDLVYLAWDYAQKELGLEASLEELQCMADYLLTQWGWPELQSSRRR